MKDSRLLRWTIAAAVVVMVPLSSFEAYALHSRLTPTTYARGGEFLTGKPTATPSAVRESSPITAPVPAPAPVGSSAAAVVIDPGTGAPTTQAPSVPGSPTRVSPSASKSPRRSTSPTKPTTGQSSALAGPALPQTGTYALSVDGTEKASFGPFGLCSGSLPTTAELAVSKAAGESDTSYDFDLRLYPGQAGKHDERHVVRYTDDGVYTDFEQATVTCFGVKQSTTLPYSPPQLSVKAPLSVGLTWKNHGGGPDRTEDATSTVTGTDSITVGTTAWPVFVIHTDVTMTGNESGSRHRTWWWSPQLGVPLRFFEQITANSSGGTYSNSYTASVTSLPQG